MLSEAGPTVLTPEDRRRGNESDERDGHARFGDRLQARQPREPFNRHSARVQLGPGIAYQTRPIPIIIPLQDSTALAHRGHRFMHR